MRKRAEAIDGALQLRERCAGRSRRSPRRPRRCRRRDGGWSALRDSLPQCPPRHFGRDTRTSQLDRELGPHTIAVSRGLCSPARRELLHDQKAAAAVAAPVDLGLARQTRSRDRSPRSAAPSASARARARRRIGRGSRRWSRPRSRQAKRARSGRRAASSEGSRRRTLARCRGARSLWGRRRLAWARTVDALFMSGRHSSSNGLLCVHIVVYPRGESGGSRRCRCCTQTDRRFRHGISGSRRPAGDDDGDVIGKSTGVEVVEVTQDVVDDRLRLGAVEGQEQVEQARFAVEGCDPWSRASTRPSV